MLYAVLINFIYLMQPGDHRRMINKASQWQENDGNLFAMPLSHSTAFSGSESPLPLKPGESLESTVSAIELGGFEHLVLFILFQVTMIFLFLFCFPLLLSFSFILCCLATLAYGL